VGQGRDQIGGFVSIRARRGLLVTVAVLVALVAAACFPAEPPPGPPPRQFPPFGGLVETDPGLFPHFSTDVTDYVSRCDANTLVLFSVKAPADTTVSVDGQQPQSGQFNTATVRDFNQSFTIVVQGPSGPPTTHYVRCLPQDFPDWSVQRPGSPQAGFYLTSPTGYPVIFDNNGVPMWWYTGASPDQALSVFFDDGNVAFGVAGGPPGPGGLPTNARFEEHALDGSLVQSTNTVNGNGEASDGHDVQRLPNGDYAMVTSKPVPGVDLNAAWNLGNSNLSSVTIIDHVIQEVKADGTLVWSWDTYDNNNPTHVPPSETDPQWRNLVLQTGATVGLYDVYHWNSIEPTPSGFLVSYRHEDAAYNINKTTNLIDWKLGGSDHTDGIVPKSLAISDPSFTNFGGQHDARWLPNLDGGSVTLHDNGSGLNRAPRALRYTINFNNPPAGKAGTATRQEQITDSSLAPSSFCCGSARRLPGGDWVMGWGGTGFPPGQVADQVIEETSSAGSLVFALQIHGLRNPLYRGTPILLPSQLTRQQLRDGMNTQVGSKSAGAQQSTSQATANGKIGPEPAP
jgi:hypothetical protein